MFFNSDFIKAAVLSVVALAISVMPICAFAETLSEAVSKSLLNNPRVEAARNNIRAAEAGSVTLGRFEEDVLTAITGKRAALMQWLPNLSLDASYQESERTDFDQEVTERVTETRDEEAIYSFEYTDEAKVLSPVVSAANGVILDMENEGSAWLLTVWIPERTDLVHLWEYAQRNDVDIELLRVNEYASLGTTDAGLTDSQRDALLVALETGYFEEPRDATLGEVAAELDISQPAAGGLLRRGIKRLVVSSLVDDGETPD